MQMSMCEAIVMLFAVEILMFFVRNALMNILQDYLTDEQLKTFKDVSTIVILAVVFVLHYIFGNYIDF